jgi:Zn-dependent protease
MSWPAIIGMTVFGIAILIASRYVAVIMTLRRLRLAPPALAEHIPLTSVPPAHAELLALAAPRLTEFGFTFEYASRAPAALVTAKPCPQYTTTWWHAASGAWAVVSLAEQPEYDALYAVSFVTFFKPAPHLYTLARRAHELVAVHPDFDMFDSAGDLRQQWQSHCERVQARGTDTIIRAKDEVAAIERRLPAETRAKLGTLGMLEIHDDGSAGLSFAGARRYLRRYTQGVRALLQRPLHGDDANGIDPLAPRAAQLRAQADVIAIASALAAHKIDPKRGNKSVLLLVTGVLSLLLFGWQFGWMFSAVLVAVLLLHELGHLAAMRWAGYRDLQIFFIPLFGAVASGQEQHASTWQKMVVLLAGPLPGIVVGCALLHGLASAQLPPLAWLLTATSTLIVINVFNLLPLVPLDGGRFFDLLLQARLPRWRGAFAALGALGLFAAGIVLQAPLMAVLGGALMLGVPAQFRHARLLTDLRRVHRDGLDNEDRWLHALSDLLSVSSGKPLPYVQRLAVARSVSASGLAAAPPFSTVLAGIALYVFSLALPVWVFAQHGVDIFATIGGDSATRQRDFDAEIAVAPDATRRLSLSLEAATYAEDAEDYSAAHGYYERALALTQGLPDSTTQKVEATLGLARNAEDLSSTEPLLEALLTTLEGDDRATRLLRAQVLVALGQDFSAPRRALSIERLGEAVAIRASLLPQYHEELLGARQVLAWQLRLDGRGADAEAQLRARLDALTAPSCDADCAETSAWSRVQAYLDLGWHLLALHEPAAAAQLVSEQAALMTAASAAGGAEDQRIAILHAWVQHANGDHDAAQATLSARLASDQPRHTSFAQLQLIIDLGCFAQAARNDDAVAHWRQQLRQRVAASRKDLSSMSLAWLSSSTSTPYSWHRPRLDAELAWLEKYEPALLAAPAP